MAFMCAEGFDGYDWDAPCHYPMSLDDHRSVLLRQIKERHVSANEKQVGGDHYRAVYQHWDWCVDHAIPHLEGSASKYVLRHRKKNGAQDLEKALHYVQKMHDVFRAKGYRNTINQCDIMMHTRVMVIGAGLGPDCPEEVVLTQLVRWRDDLDLAFLMDAIRDLHKEYVSSVRS